MLYWASAAPRQVALTTAGAGGVAALDAGVFAANGVDAARVERRERVIADKRVDVYILIVVVCWIETDDDGG